MNKIKKALLDDCREHLVFAIGSAAGAGEHETAVKINQILIDLDIACEMCYTGKNARKARKTEGKKMKKYYVVLYSDSTRFEPFYSASRDSVKHLTDHGAKECRVYDSDGYLISWAQADGDYSRNVWRCAVPKIYEPMAQEYRIEL